MKLFKSVVVAMSMLFGIAFQSFGALVINEVDYDQPGTDTAEFLELFNSGPGAISLDGYSVVLFNGSTSTVYNTIALPSISLAAGGYFVICGDVATVLNCNLDGNGAGFNSGFLQNGPPDAVGLWLNGFIVDALSYEGDSAAPYTEGSGAGLSDPSFSAFNGLSRVPNGVDTNQNNVDFAVACITPGYANVRTADNCTAPTNDIPLPGTFALLGIGLAALGWSRRRM